ncbi:6-phosphogluconolactonase [Mucilaginibacter sp. SG564]|uniref:6-phosphogluconolactonase n=1 Tax=Mucilaginibacter sp. SG564 TaxID=2587022 RepID=UPI0015564E62|nr:glucosamine-6-phosphate deaminase [Mucilaginibacter sp. SG564]NOW98371.1 galactosamine-6-phosphate isomerase/glucosamine-6-phosphate deaminase [Mucilaginibacter sp. SG564]
MTIQQYKDYDSLSSAAAYLIWRQMKKKPDSLICFPSGDSPTGMFKFLVQYAKEGKIDFSHAHFVGLDEWVGMDKNDEGSCSHYLHEHFFSKLKIAPTQVRFFNAKAADLDEECRQMNKHIKDLGGLDMMIVGIGMNGHVGLNEPGTDFNTYAHHSALAPVTIDVAKKYFAQQPQLTEGITLGLRHLAEARTPVLIASGAKKAGIIAQALTGPITTDVPASIFQKLPNAQIFLDHGATEKLNKQ